VKPALLVGRIFIVSAKHAGLGTGRVGYGLERKESP
jgi:hypothetical protein